MLRATPSATKRERPTLLIALAATILTFFALSLPALANHAPPTSAVPNGTINVADAVRDAAYAKVGVLSTEGLHSDDLGYTEIADVYMAYNPDVCGSPPVGKLYIFIELRDGFTIHDEDPDLQFWADVNHSGERDDGEILDRNDGPAYTETAAEFSVCYTPEADDPALGVGLRLFYDTAGGRTASRLAGQTLAEHIGLKLTFSTAGATPTPTATPTTAPTPTPTATPTTAPTPTPTATPTTAPTPTPTPPPSGDHPFTDVGGSMFEADITWAYEEGITAGCSPSRFCPDNAVTREQMASFLVRALKLPVTNEDFFEDDDASQHEADINRLAAAGITGGCDDDRYCPRANVTREQMASFLARALKLGATSQDFFADDNSSIHEGAINRLAASGITGGCSANAFCPSNPVTRAQMTAFLHRGMR